MAAQGRAREAALVHLAGGRPLAAVEVLHLAQERGLAARLLHLLPGAGDQVQVQD